MRYLKQFLIILAVSFLGEVLHALLPLPVPASIYGLVLMLIFLCTKVIPLRAVEETARFLVQIMPVMFVPAAVGLMTVWPQLKAGLVPIAVIMVVSTVLVMAAAGRVTQWVMRRKHREEEA